MRIVVAKTAGFCMGVRRAVDLALDAPGKEQGPIRTFGPLIHNPQVLALFEERGVNVLETIPAKGEGTILVRAHGVPPAVKQQLKQAGYVVIDATCPRVVKVQSIIKSHAAKGCAAIIVGDQDHPEVISLLGFAGDKGHVIGTMDELTALPAFDSAIVVAQTTQNQSFYQAVKEWVARNHSHYKVFDTICDSTEKRQAEVRRLAQEVEAVVVVGGKESGNTRRLAEIVAESGKPAYHVETEADLDPDRLAHLRTVGVTAGASTPTWIIKRVVRALEEMPLRRGTGWYASLLRGQRLAMMTNLHVALGAAGLCFAATRLQNLDASFPALSVAFLYVLSMHILNHLTGRAEDRYNDPERERFYSAHKWPLTALAFAAGALGLVAAFQMGRLPFWVLLAMSLLGLSYNLRLLPDRLLPGLKWRRIRDLPGSKTLLIALAWGVVTAGLPALAAPDASWLGGSMAILWTTILAFVRTAFFDMLDIQGDRIVGKETIPLLLGTKAAMTLLKVMLAVSMALLVTGAVTGVFALPAFGQVLVPALLLGIVLNHERGGLLPGLRIDFAVESLFVLSGGIALIHAVFGQVL
ncbi:4-hydroxy-3-methylbut-2-enyl diphosphate reductase [Desulfatitalea alkaliphila]|uniref:4-hydroxy-3-methylbut-2-enyl diphosphate reductase n=1 Tax=Desulfatitalea alkaliphila TaxID=2929485 RepID=A0AA41R1Q3_9BACT|nr:4-hydroxy-3-methylbut-2-enyl diphosphate reductase [Desulfatitalea alkaliphila]MCJ8501317.1 4-hydroxy-3-methylbut-2-enyl diphosphate reductase [Desulfatitalea alkaliphila]